MKAYRYASQGYFVWLVAVFATIASMLGAAKIAHDTQSERTLGAWLFVIMIGLSAACFFSAWKFLNVRNRRRLQANSRYLSGEGYSVNTDPSDELAAAFYKGTSDLVEILRFKNGHHGIRWYAFHGNHASTTRIFEHEYTTGSGKHSQVHPSTVVMWPMKNPELGDPVLAEKPMAGVSKLGWSARRAGRHIEVKDARFEALSKDWAVHGDVETAARFLKSQVVDRLLNHSPRGEMWWVGGGFIAVKIGGHLDERNLRQFLWHVREIVGARN